MNNNYKTTENIYETNGDITYITIMKKNGDLLKTKIDTADAERIKSYGIWFAEWNKDANNYIAMNISNSARNKKGKPLKQSLMTAVLDISPASPVTHISNDTLDNRKCNLSVFDRNAINEIEKIDADTTAILLRDKFGNINGKAIISNCDLSECVNSKYTWVLHKKGTNHMCVVANTKENGRVHLDDFIMNIKENEKVHHINLNPLDNRRTNLEIITVNDTTVDNS